jgi:hypothetical protein
MKNFNETVNRLHEITQTIDEKNCWTKVIDFFSLTSYLQDNVEEIVLIPLKGKETRTVWGYIKHTISNGFKKERNRTPYFSPEELKSIELRDKFINEVTKGGRDEYGYNRTKKGEKVTKDKVYFGNIYGLFTLDVNVWENTTDKEAKGLVAQQIVRFVRSYKNSFNTDWAEAA